MGVARREAWSGRGLFVPWIFFSLFHFYSVCGGVSTNAWNDSLFGLKNLVI